MSTMTLTPLREFGVWSGGNTPSKENSAYWTGGSIPWISPKDMKVDEIVSAEDHLSELAIAHGKASLLGPGAVLVVTRSGILSHTLPVAVTKVPVAINQDLKALTPKADVLPKYVAYALRGAAQRILSFCSKHGTTVASVETNALLDFRIPMTSPETQATIVEELDKQFSRLDEAVATLQRVKATLKLYRDSVLTAAVAGRLVDTEAGIARREGRQYETGLDILKRLRSVNAEVKHGRSGSASTSSEAKAPASDLPEGWALTTVGQLLSERIVNGVSMKESATPTNVRALRLSAMRHGSLDFSDFRYLPIPIEQVEDILIQPGDMYVSRGNGSLKLVGKSSMAHVAPAPTIFPDTMMRLRFPRETPLAEWLHAIWPCRLIRRQIEARVKTTAGIYKIAQPQVASIEIPLPPISEQKRIVREVDRRLSVIREVEAEADANLKRAQSLRQAILAKAFSGGTA